MWPIHEPRLVVWRQLGIRTGGSFDAQLTIFIGDVARDLRADWGDWRVSMSPAPGAETFGRSGFFLHGGSVPGSAGCIDIGGGLFGNSVTDRVLKDILKDPDGFVPVRVD